MKTFTVSQMKEYEVDVDCVAKFLAKADISTQTSFIANYFETLDAEKIDQIAQRIKGNGFHRGFREIQTLASAITHYGYQRK